jgi:hypothetical protein
MARTTVSTLDARLSALETGFAEVLEGQSQMLAAINALAGNVQPAQPAKVTKAQPKADAPAYRSAATKAKVREQVDALYAADRAKYGVKRWSDIPAKAQAETKAQIKALWAAAPKTRKTPAK